MRKKTVKTRRGVGVGGGKTKYSNFNGKPMADIIALKDFLKTISRDRDTPSRYIKDLGNESITRQSSNEHYDTEHTVDKKDNLFRTNLTKYLGCIFNYDDNSAQLCKSYLIEILENCTDNCKMYISSLKKIYQRIKEPEWMVQYDPTDEWNPKNPTGEELDQWRGNLYWLFDDVDKAVDDGNKKLIDNREDATYATYATLPTSTTVEQDGTEYSIPLVEGGRKTKRRKYKKTNKRRLKRKRTKKYSK